MKLNLFQWLWMLAALVFIIAGLLDVAEVIEFPAPYLLLSALALLFVGKKIGPSMDEIKKVDRRG